MGRTGANTTWAQCRRTQTPTMSMLLVPVDRWSPPSSRRSMLAEPESWRISRFDLASRLVPVRWTIANCNILIGPAYIITFVAFGLFMLAASYKLVNRSLVYL